MIKHVHFIGIGGTGISAIARVLLESGYQVSGSDRLLSPLAMDLKSAGVQVFEGHAPSNINGADVVVRSSAVQDDNPEVIAARAAGIPVLKRSDFLGQLMTDRYSIAIAGTHGKTTTTAMMAWVFQRLGQDPSYIIGGVSKNLGNNAHAGKGKTFVIEADEYDNMFLGLHPNLIVVTNLEHDHPDCFPTPEDYRKAFITFINQLKPGGTLLVCRDDQGALELLRAAPDGCKSISYGLSRESDFRAYSLRLNSSGGFSFLASSRETKEAIGLVDLQVPGEHNVRNALAVLVTAIRSGLVASEVAHALSEFTGTGRRFDIQGEPWNVMIIDDYAHHPSEIETTLAAARSRYPHRRIWAVWQPHTYSRTRTLLPAFLKAFQNADRVVVTEIYAAREKNQNFSSMEVVRQMSHPSATYMPSLTATSQFLLKEVNPGDVVLVLSAGDADQVSALLLAGLKEREVSRV